MDALSQQHIDWLRAQNDWAENTIASRTRVLRSVGNAGTATREDLETWWQTRTHLAPGTRAVDLSHLREFYKWCMIYEHLDKDPQSAYGHHAKATSFTNTRSLTRTSKT